MRRDFMADISHELRTPLAVLRGELEAIRDGVRITSSRPTPLLLCRLKWVRSPNWLTTFISSPCQMKGALAYQKSSLDLIPLLEVASGAFRERFASRGLTIQLSLPDSMTVFGDRDRLMRFVQQSAGKQPALHRQRRRAAHQRRTTRTHGVINLRGFRSGVSDEQLQKLFERF